MKCRFSAISLVVAVVIAIAGFRLALAEKPVVRPASQPIEFSEVEPGLTPNPTPTAVAVSNEAQMPKDVVSKQYRLKNIDATEAARKISAALIVESKTTLKVEGVMVLGPAIVVPVYRTNSLIVIATDEKHLRISKLVAELDVERTQVVVQCSVVRKTADGKDDIISRPQFRTLDGQQATIRIDKGQGEFLEISVTPRVVPTATEKAANVDPFAP